LLALAAIGFVLGSCAGLSPARQGWSDTSGLANWLGASPDDWRPLCIRLPGYPAACRYCPSWCFDVLLRFLGFACLCARLMTKQLSLAWPSWLAELSGMAWTVGLWCGRAGGLGCSRQCCCCALVLEIPGPTAGVALSYRLWVTLADVVAP